VAHAGPPTGLLTDSQTDSLTWSTALVV